ncbi:CHAP domain-containing protein [Leucobacter ruminantium]|uniref:CHAP domain-containing protein n=1 Tax=Leucobacter ruminantium TaxID=1289170 RepID=A0A939M2J7_9MICO|nr:CHAP domain-containing protein [Leucobacter ruminantium]MBO1805830.1 hypothetical protein [Leucobacter ruminantium]
MATPNLAAYIASVRGRYIDVDRSFGAQCWDQWSHYATTFLGVPTGPTYTNAGGAAPHSGWACNVYHNAARSGLDRWFDILPANASPRAGDVAFWEYGSAWYPLSHVATVLDVTHGGRMLRCLTQNPGAVQIADLVVSGVIGYLRPKALATGGVDASRSPSLTASQKLASLVRRRNIEGDSMYIYCADSGTVRYAILTPGVKGSWIEFTGQDSANQLASQRGNAMKVVQSFWDDLKRRHS